MNRKKRIMLILLIIPQLLFSGCWDYREIDDIAVVMGLAVDYDKSSDMLLLTLEIATAIFRKQESLIEPQIINERGRNIFEINHKIVGRIGQRLFWGHTKIIIINKSVMEDEDKFIGILDWFKRETEAGEETWVLFALNDSAKELLEQEHPRTEMLMSTFLNDVIENSKSISEFHVDRLWRFTENLEEEGKSPVMPIVELSENNESDGTKIVTINGTAVFKGAHYVGKMDSEESKCFLTAVNELKGGSYIIDYPSKEESVNVSLEIYNNKTKRKISVSSGKDKKIIVEMEVSMAVGIAEINGNVDVISKEERVKLQEMAQEQIRTEMEGTIQKIQNELKSDILGYGSLVKAEQPELWNEVGKKWSEVFPEVKTIINVNLDIRGSALRNKPIEVKK